MFDHVLVPLDGSTHSEAILPVLSQVVGTPARVTLLHAVNIDAVTVVDLPGMGGVNFAGMLEAMLEAGGTYLEGQAGALREAGAEVAVQCVADGPAQAIFEAAAGASLIAMASHGRSGAQRWLLGSVAERVLRGAPCPVLLVRPTDETPSSVERVVVGVDGSKTVEAILPLAGALAGQHGAAVELVACVERGDADWAARAEGYLAEAAAGLDEGVASSTAVRQGPVAEELSAHARECGAGLIVLATHARRGLSRVILGSVTEEVLRQTSVPLLVTSANA